MKLRTRLASVLLAALLTLPTLAAENEGFDHFQKVQTYTDGTFQDVNTEDWFYENVKSVNELGLMIGRDPAFFGTEGNMTVAEAMTIAARLHAIYHTGVAEFTQERIWYQVYTDYCLANGIADPGQYDLDVPVTRAQFAVIFANAFPDEALEAVNTVEDNAIPDVKFGDSCAIAVYTLYRAGILTGNDQNGTFAPDSYIRRSEAAAIVTRMALPELRQTVTLGTVTVEALPEVVETDTGSESDIDDIGIAVIEYENEEIEEEEEEPID